MPQIEFHNDKYHTASKLKLELFEQYLRSWLPVFIHRPDISTIRIFDFYCGPGSDDEGSLGSPLRIIRVLNEFSDNLRQEGKEVIAYFADKNESKVIKLQKRTHDAEINDDSITIKIETAQFESSFPKSLALMKQPRVANFLFIDPCGLAVTIDHFKELTQLKNTDFLLFIPASFVRRFVDNDDTFKQYFPGLKYDGHVSIDNIHKIICNYYKTTLRRITETYYLAPFSIRKGNNMNGLILCITG